MPYYRAKTALACDLGCVDRQRFNDAVRDGFYLCAPATVRGSSRVFDANDIVALTVWGRLLDRGASPRFAGNMACGLRDLLREYPHAEKVAYVSRATGSPAWYLSEHLPEASASSFTDVHEWFLEPIRQRVDFRLAEESKVLGSEDGTE